MNVINIEDYKSKLPSNQPREITFFSPVFYDTDGNQKTVNICVRIEDGDVFGILSVVMENQGIGETSEDGTFLFIPYPCAAIEVKDV